MRTAVAKLFFEGLAHTVDVAVLAEDQRQHDPVVARANLTISAVIAHKGTPGPGGRIRKVERNRMPLRSVAAGAMAYVARGEESALEDGLRSFSHNHAVHNDQVARLQVHECKLLFCWNVLSDGDR